MIPRVASKREKRKPSELRPVAGEMSVKTKRFALGAGERRRSCDISRREGRRMVEQDLRKVRGWKVAAATPFRGPKPYHPRPATCLHAWHGMQPHYNKRAYLHTHRAHACMVLCLHARMLAHKCAHACGWQVGRESCCAAIPRWTPRIHHWKRHDRAIQFGLRIAYVLLHYLWVSDLRCDGWCR